MAYQVTERLYVDAAGKVYTESELTERTEAVLLMSEGGELSDEDAKKYGLTAPAKKAAPETPDPSDGEDEPEADTEAKAAPETPDPSDGEDEPEADTEAKAVSAPPANKARSASETK